MPHPETPFDAEPSLPTSDLLICLVEDVQHDQVTIGELIDGMGGRAFSVILLLLTLPIAVPGPPGLPMVFAVPLMIVAGQLLFGRSSPWLPEFVRGRRFSRSALLTILRKVRPVLAALESVSKPRLTPLSSAVGQRWIGAFLFVCAVVLTNPVPIPFSHLPLAMALAFLSLGLVERDGVIIVSGAIAALDGIAINLSLTGGMLVLGLKLLHMA